MLQNFRCTLTASGTAEPALPPRLDQGLELVRNGPSMLLAQTAPLSSRHASDMVLVGKRESKLLI